MYTGLMRPAEVCLSHCQWQSCGQSKSSNMRNSEEVKAKSRGADQTDTLDTYLAVLLVSKSLSIRVAHI